MPQQHTEPSECFCLFPSAHRHSPLQPYHPHFPTLLKSQCSIMLKPCRSLSDQCRASPQKLSARSLNCSPNCSQPHSPLKQLQAHLTLCHPLSNLCRASSAKQPARSSSSPYPAPFSTKPSASAAGQSPETGPQWPPSSSSCRGCATS